LRQKVQAVFIERVQAGSWMKSPEMVVRPVCRGLVVLALLLAMTRADARTVHSIFLTPETGTTADVEKRIAGDLQKSGGVRVVSDRSGADAVLQVNSVIWPQGLIAVNPRSRNVSVSSYQGYASAELRDAGGQVLWSYLVTPRRFRVSGIEEDLADQLTENLLNAVKAGLTEGNAPQPMAGTATGMSLRVAGATFPAPLYRKWFETYGEQQGGARVSYDAVGSSAGIAQLANAQVDVAASDIPGSPGGEDALVARFPTVVGGVVPIYNLPGLTSELRLTGPVLADIYSGKIRKWNDERIRQWNKGANLPDADIAVVHRSDGSGTTFVWTSFLAEARPEWKARVGDHIDWRVGAGAEGNQGVAALVARTPHAIGYVELTYAIQQRLQYAAVRNPAGAFVRADIGSITAAVAGTRVHSISVLNAPGAGAYPIATFTWFLVPKGERDAQKRAAVAALLQWVLTEGQKECSALAYVPLPRDVVNQELEEVKALR